MKHFLHCLLCKLRTIALIGIIALAFFISSIAHAILDINANGMSDLWEKQHNNGIVFPATFLSTADDDQDGWTNGTEAIAGTDPFLPNPPNGIIATTIEHTSTEGAFTLTWPTIIGKNYRLQASSNLTDWLNVGTAIVGTTNSHTLGISAVQPDTTVPAKLFWRIVASDLDNDGDGLTNAEEIVVKTDPESPNTLQGIPDQWLATHFTAVLLTAGPTGVNLTGDHDGDGSSNLEEYLNSTDPNVPDLPTKQQWVIVIGDGEQNAVRTRTKQITIPKGKSMLAVVAIASDEYPEFTEPDEIQQYNDLLTWSIEPTGQNAITGEVNVNNRHADWLLAEIDGQSLAGLPGPVHFELVKTITAPEASDLIIDVENTATNIADGLLPSYVAVGLLPIEIVTPKVDVAGTEISGELVYATELKVAKMENSLTVEKKFGEITKEVLDINTDIDRFYVRILGAAPLTIAKDVSVMLKTVNNVNADYNDDETEIKLTAGNGNLTSKSLILTSDQVDDDFAGAVEIGEDDNVDDRSHVIQLGGDLELSNIKIGNDEHDLNLKMPVQKKKKVTVNFAILNDGNINIQNVTADIHKDLKVMNERYAQVGIELVSGGISPIPTPSGLNLSNNQLKVTTTEKSLSNDCKTVIKACGTVGNVNDIHIVYSPYPLIDHRDDPLDGVALTDYFNENAGDAGYLSNVLLTIGQPLAVALSHEIGHILSEDHVEVWAQIGDSNWLKKKTNLMTAEPEDFSDTRISGSRRLWQVQETRLRASAHSKDP